MPIDLTIFTLPFMQRAIMGGVLVALLTSIIGVFAVLRKASFYGDTIAHSSLTGVALGLLLHLHPTASALVVALILSFLLPLIQQRSKLHIDAVLGFILPVSMAIGVILLSFLPGYQPELMSFLFGSILSISWTNLLFIAIISILALGLVALFSGKLLSTAVDETYAHITGINTFAFALLHNALLTLAIVPSINLVGVILVNALLTIPAATAKQLTTSLKGMFIISPIIALVSILLGIALSVFLNMPTGPSIVVILGVLFILLPVIVKPVKDH